MIHVRASRANRIRLNGEIINFYTNLWYDRLVNLTKRKYAYALVWRNVRNVLTFYGKTFDDNQLKKSPLPLLGRGGRGGRLILHSSLFHNSAF
jgi:hypothetical protein